MSSHIHIQHHHKNHSSLPNHTPYKPKQKRWYTQSRIILVLLFVFFAGAVTLTGYYFFYNEILKDLPNTDKLRNFQSTPLSSHIYDRNGELLYEVFSDQNRTPVKIKDLPKYVGQASVAIEDKDFYTHSGVSLFSGVLRAVKENVLNRSGLQGGSTLTQQLVKLALLTPERTWKRKVKEIVLAMSVEKKYNKDEILEMYLNQIPYGGSAYGVEEAANAYFNKKAKDLTIAEAALLAGLPQLPSKYNPFVNPDAAVARRNEVLQKMFEQKYITQAQYKEGLATTLVTNPPFVNIKAPHFVFYVKALLEQEFGSEVVGTAGLNIYTSIDMPTQNEAQKILQEELDKVRYLSVGNAAALVTRPVTGEILAMVGSYDYFASPSGSFNVTTALRQPGSSIKPVNYSIALDRGLITPASVLLDVPTCFKSPGKPYCPQNYDVAFRGPMKVRYALANSNNIIAVKVLALNTVDSFIASSSGFLIDSFQEDPSRYGLSLTLGGGEMRMTELVQAYSTFPNRGKPRKLQSILKITDANGKILYKYQDPNFVQDIHAPIEMPNYLAMGGKRVISEEASFLISHILYDNNARKDAFGPSSQLNIKGNVPVSVKTGTTDSKKDNWTVGYTPNFMVAVWVGNNDNTPMNQALASGVTGAAPIWNGIMSKVLEGQPILYPVKPEGVVGRRVCKDGRLEGADGGACGDTEYEYFKVGTENVRTARVTQGKVWVNKDTDKQAKQGDENTEERDKTVMKDMFSDGCLDCAK
ncbi:MAG: transglycosylase domain-containing protein [Candidatus Roizmanbacteria bacterium]